MDGSPVGVVTIYLEVCVRKKGYEGLGSQRVICCPHEDSEVTLRATLEEEILRESGERRDRRDNQ